jgi:hypothetical protein
MGSGLRCSVFARDSLILQHVLQPVVSVAPRILPTQFRVEKRQCGGVREWGQAFGVRCSRVT